MKKADKFKSVVSFALLFVLMVIMFFFSAQNGEESGGVSQGVTEAICQAVFDDFDSASPETRELVVSGLNHYVRKLAHFTIYALMGVCAYNGLLALKTRIHMKAAAAAGICLAYAVFDEVHQLFVPERAFMPTDVLIDLCGALVGMGLLRIVILISEYLRDIRKERKVLKGR